jgi:hypothetical protein
VDKNKVIWFLFRWISIHAIILSNMQIAAMHHRFPIRFKTCCISNIHQPLTRWKNLWYPFRITRFGRAIFRLGFLPAVAGCLRAVPCDPYPHLQPTSGWLLSHRRFWFQRPNNRLKHHPLTCAFLIKCPVAKRVRLIIPAAKLVQVLTKNSRYLIWSCHDNYPRLMVFVPGWLLRWSHPKTQKFGISYHEKRR